MAGSSVLAACGGGDDSASIPEPALPALPAHRFADERLVLSEPMLQRPTANAVRVRVFDHGLLNNPPFFAALVRRDALHAAGRGREPHQRRGRARTLDR